MCSWIIEKANVRGSGKGALGWFALTGANVCYDHPTHVPLDHALLIDFVNERMGPSARVAVELSEESARELVRAILAALETAEEVHGRPQAVRANS